MYLTHALHRANRHWADQVMTVDGDRVRTVREVAERVPRLAGALHDCGVGPGDPVAVVALNSDRHHETCFASWWLGGIATPINTRWSATEIALALNDSGSKVVLLDDTRVDIADELRQRVPGLRAVIHCGRGAAPADMLAYEELIGAADPATETRRDEGEVAILVYTGGTTGVPKGVSITHRSFTSSLLSCLMLGVTQRPGGVTMLTAPLFHIGALGSWYGQNLLGGTSVFLPVFTPEAVLQAIQKHRVTGCALVPAMMQRLCEHPDFDRYDLSSLELISYGAAASTQSQLDQAMSHFRTVRFVQAYGMTETNVLTVLDGDDHRSGGARLRSVGRPTPAVELRVVDADGQSLAPGQMGEVVTRGDFVMAGYWNKPEATAAAIRDGWLHTGDAGYLDEDGYLYIADRLKDMIITGGENVYSAEVENALASHPAVAASAVIGVPDEQWGERVHAIVVLRPGHSASAEELRIHAKTLIAGYKAPRSVEFVDALPLSATGKILKRDLRAARTGATTPPPTTEMGIHA